MGLFGKKTITVSVMSSIIILVSFIWFYPTNQSEASPFPVPTQVIDIDPLDPGDFEFIIQATDSFRPGVQNTLHLIDLAPDGEEDDENDHKNKVSFHFRDATSRSDPDNNVFAHEGVFLIGTSFIAPHTGRYEIAFQDDIDIDGTESFASMNYLDRPRADDNYVAAFAKFSYDVVANDPDDTEQNLWTTQNQADKKDLEVLISAANIKAEEGVPPPVTTFATEQPERADLIAVGGAAVGRALVSVLGGAAGCPICGTALGAVIEEPLEEEIRDLLNEESNIFTDAISLGEDSDGRERILVRSFFGRDITDVTTFDVELEKDELVVLSSRVIVGINQVDSSSRHRHSAGIAGVYELQGINIRIFESTPPVITLKGDNPLILEAGDTLVDPGAIVTDNVDGDLTGTLVVDSSGVDTNTVGTYQITYNASPDTQGNVPLQVSRTVEVIDTTPPEISLLGDNPLILKVGSIYDEPGAIVTDNTDEDLSLALMTDASGVDTSTLGTYQVTYNVQDSSGNLAQQVIRTVEVFDEVIETILDGPLNVGDGERVLISGGTINGNIKIGNGVLILKDSIVNGNIQGNEGSTLVLESSTVHGFVQMKNCNELTISDSIIDSNVTVHNCTSFSLTDSTVGGIVDSKDTDTVEVTGNSVDGNISSNTDGQVTIDNNILIGIITVS